MPGIVIGDSPLKIKIMRDKLVVPLILADQIRLPREEAGSQAPLEFFIFSGKTGVNAAGHVRKIIPAGDARNGLCRLLFPP